MKLIFVKRRFLTLVACCLAAVGMFYVVSHPAIVGTAATTRKLPIYCVQRDQKMLSLSFDAAWADGRLRQINGINITLVDISVILRTFHVISLQTDYERSTFSAPEIRDFL